MKSACFCMVVSVLVIESRIQLLTKFLCNAVDLKVALFKIQL